MWFNIRIIDLPLPEQISNLPHISDFFTFHSLVCGKYEYFTSILRSPDTIWPLSENGRCSTISSKFRNKPKQKLLAQGNSLIFEGLFGGVYFLRVLYPEGRTFRILRNAEEDRCQVVVLTTSFFLLTALTIRCYECAPNFSSVSGANMCNNPVDAITCTDPSQDSCLSISLTGHTGNASDFAKFTFHSLNCTSKFLCDRIKNLICDLLKTEANTPDVKLENCEMSCCQGDLCNKPLGGPSTSSFPRSITPPSPSARTTKKISLGSTIYPLNCALFVILGVIPVVVMDIF